MHNYEFKSNTCLTASGFAVSMRRLRPDRPISPLASRAERRLGRALYEEVAERLRQQIFAHTAGARQLDRRAGSPPTTASAARRCARR
jgi:glucan phosphorylase